MTSLCVKQGLVDIYPGMTLTVQHADGTYRQHDWGLRLRGKLVYNALEEELDVTWGKTAPRVSIPLDGFYEPSSLEKVYVNGPHTAKGIVVLDKVLIITTSAQRIALFKQPAISLIVG